MPASSPNECRRANRPKPFTAAVVVCFLCVGAAVAHESEPATIRVPADYASIQQAINAAASGDMVTVSPGTYYETIDFLGKDITVTSEQGPQVTIIDGHDAGSVVSFKMGETRNAVLSGFTLRGGYTKVFGGGGIAILSSSPTIRDNIIRDNHVCGSGAGISSLYGSPLIEHNTITHNGLRGCTGGGLGIYVYGNSAAEIIGNLITENNDNGTGSVFGGGMSLNATGNVTVRGNVISNNVIVAPVGGCSARGGAMAIANSVQGTIVDNLIVGNKACFAAAIHWIGYASNGGSAFVNNTVADNEGRFGAPAIYTAGVDGRTWIANNVISTRSGPALLCDNVVNLPMPILASNDMFRGDVGSPYAGTCADQTGLNGNVSADPLFVDPANGDYRVRMTSPVIDAGNDTAPQIPPVDFTGGSRIVDGNGDGVEHVDMGAFEYRNHPPVAVAGEDQRLIAGSNCVARVSLDGSGSDPDGEALTYTWTGPSGATAGPAVSMSLPVGTHVFTLTVDDHNGGFASDTVVITVLDTMAPEVTALTATPSVILQTNHEMVPVVVSASISDCDSPASCRIVSVTSNEPDDGLGDGDTATDWKITGDLTLDVRAERAGRGTGRVYTITVACTDASGNTSTSTVTVTVPHDF
jgi:Right handed beta helix region/K319L-like, PKD domain